MDPTADSARPSEGRSGAQDRQRTWNGSIPLRNLESGRIQCTGHSDKSKIYGCSRDIFGKWRRGGAKQIQNIGRRNCGAITEDGLRASHKATDARRARSSDTGNIKNLGWISIGQKKLSGQGSGPNRFLGGKIENERPDTTARRIKGEGIIVLPAPPKIGCNKYVSGAGTIRNGCLGSGR